MRKPAMKTRLQICNHRPDKELIKFDAMPEAKVKEALITLRGAFTAANAEQMVGAMRTLDSLLAEHSAVLDPRLVHFLAGRSYAKAFALLGIDDSSTDRARCAGGGR